ncbi:hypothetical protein E4U21_004298 [Claviceps maximensis]|nr:hypothetical protein E4U21_004298 [Claviceps maximensis]
MKFTTLLSGLALTALQTVFAAPLEDSTGLEERADTYCCVGASRTIGENVFELEFFYLARGSAPLAFTVDGCHGTAIRNANNCDNWSFTLQGGCAAFNHDNSIAVTVAGNCRGH